MQGLSKSQKARIAIRTFKVLADALTIRGYYKVFGKTGLQLAGALKLFRPEIYGSMGDSRIVELKGLEYVIDRLPRGIEKCNRIILTAQEDFQGTAFEEVVPPKRRRVCYKVSEKEMCFVITRGLTEIYDILTHITFMGIESQKISQRIGDKEGGTSLEWLDLEKAIEHGTERLSGAALDQAIWNLSIILGRTYRETRESYDYVERHKKEGNHNSGFFQVIYNLGKRYQNEQISEEEQLAVYFTPSLHEMIEHHKYAASWAVGVKAKLCDLQLHNRPVHLISANMHSVKNLLYGAVALKIHGKENPDDLYEMISAAKKHVDIVNKVAEQFGYTFVRDKSGSNIDVNIIDTAKIDLDGLRPELEYDLEYIQNQKPVILVIDYAFGTQAFQIMDELLNPYVTVHDDVTLALHIESISVMGKAGILPGNKGDIMLATAHVMEGTPHNYIVDNDLKVSDFDGSIDVYSGPMVTVLGTSLQNKDILERFHLSSWGAIGLEMEGAHYQRAINAAIIQGHIPSDMKIRYAYYASDNPLKSGQTLAAGPMGVEGIAPTYMITRILLKKIMTSTLQKA
ncbi:MAG: hypothetical protein V2I36_13410 [Desulfopila sp.]|jgi:hypothetical protein|nr:hypothetical protein [Desulfopila sp.]